MCVCYQIVAKEFQFLKQRERTVFLTRVSPNERIRRKTTMKIAVTLLVILTKVQLNDALNVVR